jgi:hypothetical protein
MGHVAYSITVSFALFAGILVCWEIGRRLGLRRHTLDPEAESVGIGAVEGAVFGLMGLLLAFSFSGAMTRWDVRRELVVEETNDIGTAWLRIDLLPEAVRPELRALFRQYLDARLAVYKAVPDIESAFAELARADALQKEIWARAVAECSKPEGEPARMLLLPALNDMIDITTTRTVAAKTHPPVVINALLIGLVLASSLMAGSAMANDRSRGWVHMIGFALAMSVSIYLIFDLEYPRQGLIRIDAVDQILVDLRATMN